MATLEQVGELVTTELRERVGDLAAAVEEETLTLGEVSRLADALAELADEVAGIYADLEQTLMRGLHDDAAPKQEGNESRRGKKKNRRKVQRQQHSEGNGSAAEDVTKEELLGRARDVNVHGRSAMSKEELVQAVEAEESQSKEELLERAREAEIEGRSSMTKDELRDAVTDADA